MNHLFPVNKAFFFTYFLIVSSYGYWIYRKCKNQEHDAKALFIEEGSLIWWSIGASLGCNRYIAQRTRGANLRLIHKTGLKVNPKSFIPDRNTFKLDPTIVLILIIPLIISPLYIRFW